MPTPSASSLCRAARRSLRTPHGAARRGGYRALVLDFEGHATSDVEALAAVVHALADSAEV